MGVSHMSIDKLQEKIRKCKNPSVIDFSIQPELLPPYLLESEGSFIRAYSRFCAELLEGLSGLVPAVRFSFSGFALYGAEGLSVLSGVLKTAREKSFYIILDAPEMLSAPASAAAANALLLEACPWDFDGVLLASYIGSDGLRPYIDKMNGNDKDLFSVIRTSNKTAPELQDLLTGSRLVHMAKADTLNRFAAPYVGKCGYSRVAALAAASAPDSLRSLRSKYKTMFLLLDGYDYPNANAKNCSYAFDKFGHGAAACAGASVIAAWREAEPDGWQYVAQAVMAAERMKKNLTRYITVL